MDNNSKNSCFNNVVSGTHIKTYWRKKNGLAKLNQFIRLEKRKLKESYSSEMKIGM
jgi:hypothetical protein